MSALYTIVVPAVCVVPSLIYNYLCYREHRDEKMAFLLINMTAVLCVFTIYLAGQLPN